MALGAAPGDILRLIAAHGARLLLVGCGVGAVLATLSNGLITRQFGEVVPTDPLTVGVVVGLFVLVGLGAALIPAWRAAQVDPLGVLRDET